MIPESPSFSYGEYVKEVEAVIRDFPGVKDVTVQAFDSEGGEKYRAAYVVSDTQIDVKALNEFIGSRKPSYMIPAVTMQIDAIPLNQNQNQKANCKALPKPEITPAHTESVAVSEGSIQKIHAGSRLHSRESLRRINISCAGSPPMTETKSYRSRCRISH